MDEFDWLPADCLDEAWQRKIAEAFERKMNTRKNSKYYLGVYALILIIVIFLNHEWDKFAITLPFAFLILFALFFSGKKTVKDEFDKTQNLAYDWREGSLTRAVIRSKGTDYFYVDKQKCCLLPFQHQRTFGSCPKKGDAIIVIRIMLENGRYEYFAVKKDILK